jgi:hypothetical protein
LVSVADLPPGSLDDMALRPTDAPDWATDATHAAGVADWSGKSNKVKPSAGKIAAGFTPNEDFAVEYENFILNTHGQWINFLDASNTDFGDGSDGTVTLGAGTTTLARDMYYQDLNIPAGAILASAGYRIFVNGTLTIAGLVDNSGLAGSASVGTAGGIGGAGGPGGSLPPGGFGADGATSVANAFPAAAQTNSLGGSGGAGANGSTRSGSSGGAATAPTSGLGGYRSKFTAITGGIVGTSGLVRLTPGAGGGGGGGTGTGGGPGGGGGGGCIFVVARVIACTGAGPHLQAKGGNGFTGNGSTIGGAGGGGGGLIVVLSSSVTGLVTSVVGGTKGGPGASGADGSPGLYLPLSAPAGAGLITSPATHVEKGFAAITPGTGNGHEYLDVSWTIPFLAATGASGYSIGAQINPTTLADTGDRGQRDQQDHDERAHRLLCSFHGRSPLEG